MSHKHYCDVEGHEWQCSDGSCECVCDLLMEQGDHSDCPIELRACPEHQDMQLPESSNDGSFSDFLGNLQRYAEKPYCECGCADAHHEEVVGFCAWCTHVYESYDAKTEAQHFALFCTGAPEKIRRAMQARLARFNRRYDGDTAA